MTGSIEQLQMTGLYCWPGAAAALVLCAAWTAFEPLAAETGDQSAAVAAATDTVAKGRVTGRKIPRFVSMKKDRGWARRGPSRSHRIDWEFTQRGLPLLVTDEYGLWRRVQTIDGSGGWMHHALLTGTRFVMVATDRARLRVSPDEFSPVRALAEKNLIARLGKCNRNWCLISAGGYKGWVSKSEIWGVDADEIRD